MTSRASSVVTSTGIDVVASASGVKSAIDLGTNTILMVTGRRREDGSVQVLDDAHAIARLGKGVDAAGTIDPETMDRVCGFLLSYRERAHALGAETVRAFGTSALRDAANKSEFIDLVSEKTGIPLVELSGEEEARLTFDGAAFGLELPQGYTVVDIGGGSTELASGGRVGLEKSLSVDIGAVRVTERHFQRLPPGELAVKAAVTMIRKGFLQLFELPPGCDTVVGVAGTVTTLGAIDRGIERFDAEELDGHFLERRRVEELTSQLLSLSLDQVRAIPQVNEQRADIITAGALILHSFLELRGCSGVIVSTRGIRYGLLGEMLAEG